ncbi:NAD-dependent epimerase/dehydratase family protein [Aliirhizobium smilacinae]|uniref:NAD(P)-dependent oxidoreductase n=1 Tax=Aliirhizobium smilacinae TaxID=1395944 RepID=A0A5C4XJ97_9HYPH|nr:NAD(P)-dependent oxidoreductase [Rhizobium smilacinae]TNM62700.1 NAD(P)-dependent oxidoreductase [Rhizobium smilacinae]
MKVLVSGGTGLVGRYIVEGLLAAGYDVVVGARKRPSKSMFSHSLDFRPLQLDPKLDQTKAFEDIEAFVHAAFDHLPGKYRGGEGNDPQRFRHVNLTGSIKLFEAAKKAGVKRTTFLSSRAVYDGLPSGTILTEALPLSPTSLYGEIKLACEQALAELSGQGFVTSSLRATGVYGELRPNKWDDLMADALAGKPLAPRAGTEVHGADVAQAVRLMLESDAQIINGESFNLSDVTVDTRMIVEKLGLSAPLVAFAALSANVMDTEKLRRIGWKPGGLRQFDETMATLARQLGADH